MFYLHADPQTGCVCRHFVVAVVVIVVVHITFRFRSRFSRSKCAVWVSNSHFVVFSLICVISAAGFSSQRTVCLLLRFDSFWLILILLAWHDCNNDECDELSVAVLRLLGSVSEISLCLLCTDCFDFCGRPSRLCSWKCTSSLSRMLAEATTCDNRNSRWRHQFGIRRLSLSVTAFKFFNDFFRIAFRESKIKQAMCSRCNGDYIGFKPSRRGRGVSASMADVSMGRSRCACEITPSNERSWSWLIWKQWRQSKRKSESKHHQHYYLAELGGVDGVPDGGERLHWQLWHQHQRS